METMATWRRSLGMVFIIARSHVTGHHHQRVTCNHSAKQDNIPRRERKGGMKEKKKRGGEKKLVTIKSRKLTQTGLICYVKKTRILYSVYRH